MEVKSLAMTSWSIFRSNEDVDGAVGHHDRVCVAEASASVS